MFGGSLDKDGLKKLFSSTMSLGDVLLKEFPEADHEKFFIIAGMSKDRVFICSVFINSNIHPSIFNKQELLNLQVPLKRSENPYLKYDSFANCSYPIPLEVTQIAQQIAEGKCKVIGAVTQDDLENVRSSIINSGLLSEEEIELYFN
jgi:hypothetical protein